MNNQNNYNNPYNGMNNAAMQYMQNIQAEMNRLNIEHQNRMTSLNAQLNQFGQQFNPNQIPQPVNANPVNNNTVAPVEEKQQGIPIEVQTLSVLGEIRTLMNDMLSIWKSDKPENETKEVEKDVKQVKNK